MSIDGLFLHQLHKEIKQYLPAKINKLYLVSDTELLLFCYGNHKSFKLLISTNPSYARMNITSLSYPTPETPANFTMLLRKYIENGIIQSLEQMGLDRVFCFDITSRNEIGDENATKLYVELMGKYANIILVDKNNKIIDALKRIPPFINNKRTIWPTSEYVRVEALNRKNPLIDFNIDDDIPLIKQFDGFSPLLAAEVEYRLKNKASFSDIMNEIESSKHMYIHNINGKDEIGIIPYTHLNIPYRIYDINEGFDIIFHEAEEKERIKQQTGDLFKFVHKELVKNTNKLKKLEDTLEDANNSDKYRIYGDLLYAYGYKIPKGAAFADLEDFETGETIHIPLDVKYDYRYNAKKMYQKYTKGKNAQVIVKEQIEKCQKEIDYFELLEAQLEQASFNDAAEIRAELSSKGYMKAISSKIRKKKNPIPAFLTYEVEGIRINVGKNNLQNDYITWKHSRKEYIWLHAKDIHGSHVVIETNDPNEAVLRAGANLAAYYSKARNSSSVPVNYTSIKQLKKIPNAALGMVQLGSYKTIYIDPDIDIINTYKLIK